MNNNEKLVTSLRLEYVELELAAMLFCLSRRLICSMAAFT